MDSRVRGNEGVRLSRQLIRDFREDAEDAKGNKAFVG